MGSLKRIKNIITIELICIWGLFIGLNCIMTMCTMDFNRYLNRQPTYEVAKKYYADKACAKLSCAEPSIDCVKYCYIKEVGDK